MVFSKIKNDIRQAAAKINPLLAAAHWKRSHYVILADLINEELGKSPFLAGDRKYSLGNTVSPITLQRFFEDRYSKSAVNDLRFLKTVDKFAIFLGFENFSTYNASTDAETPVTSVLQDQFFCNLIADYLATEFKVFAALPEDHTAELDQFVFASCPHRARVCHWISVFAKNKLRLVQENHCSSYELMDIKVLKRDEKKCTLETREFWNMVFRSDTSGEDYVYHKVNTQNYFLEKDGDLWRIWDSYNPNAGELVRVVDINGLAR